MAEVEIKEIIRQKRKTLSMTVNPDATITIKAPNFTPMSYIRSFIKDNDEWIEKRIRQIRERPKVVKHKFAEGEEFMFLGKTYSLKLGHYPLITIDKYLRFPVSKKNNIKEKLSQWYKTRAMEVVRSRVDHFARRMGVDYSSIRLTNAERRWGSCSHDNNLRFNWKLVMAPTEIIDYVVVHELAHIIHKNHSRMFWITVRNFIPDARRRINWLRNNGHILRV